MRSIVGMFARVVGCGNPVLMRSPPRQSWRRTRFGRDAAIVDHPGLVGRKGVIVVLQQGQVFRLRGDDDKSLWVYRYRVGGRGSRWVQRGGFASERDASGALERALERLRRERGCGSALTLGELVDEYLAQHDGEPETIEKLSGCSRNQSRSSALAGCQSFALRRSQPGG
jgi:hypothetical protein